MPSLIYKGRRGKMTGREFHVLFDEEDRDLAEASYVNDSSGKFPRLHLNTTVDGVKKCVLTHKLIAARMGLVGAIVDHVNGNPIDNRRENLRPSDRRHNQRNRNPRGVHAAHGKWQGRVSLSTPFRDPSDMVGIADDKLFTLAMGKAVKLNRVASGKVYFKIDFHGPLRESKAEAFEDYLHPNTAHLTKHTRHKQQVNLRIVFPDDSVATVKHHLCEVIAVLLMFRARRQANHDGQPSRQRRRTVGLFQLLG